MGSASGPEMRTTHTAVAEVGVGVPAWARPGIVHGAKIVVFLAVAPAPDPAPVVCGRVKVGPDAAGRQRNPLARLHRSPNPLTRDIQHGLWSDRNGSCIVHWLLVVGVGFGTFGAPSQKFCELAEIVSALGETDRQSVRRASQERDV